METRFTWLDFVKSLWYFLDGHRLKFVFWNFVAFIGHSNMIIMPLILGFVVDFFISYKDGDSLFLFYVYISILAGLFIFNSIIRLYGKRKLTEININLGHDIRVNGFKKLVDFSVSWHEKENSGVKVEKINSCSSSITSFMSLLMNDGYQVLMAFIGILLVFLILNRSFLIFFGVYLFLVMIVDVYFLRKMTHIKHLIKLASEKSSGVYYESTSNILSVKSSGSKNTMVKGLKKVVNKVKELQIIDLNIKNARRITVHILNGVFMFVFFILISKFILAGIITVGLIATYFTYFQTVTNKVFQLMQLAPKFINYKINVMRAMPIFIAEEEKYFGNKQFPSKWKKIIFDNVSHSYGENLDLNKISLDIKHNSKVGIVGKTGSGKSTISKILLGLYKIKDGNINIDGADFYSFSYNSLLKNVSIVLQDSELFNMTLKENVTMMSKSDKKLFNKAVEIAQLKELIKKLPEGANTYIGEKGYRLSGGERQRVNLARAIYRNTPILVLDEATSALDSKTEQKIQKGLESLKKKTVITVAHRLSTIKNCDDIVVMSKGKLIEKGSFNNLIKDKKSDFYSMWKLQN